MSEVTAGDAELEFEPDDIVDAEDDDAVDYPDPEDLDFDDASPDQDGDDAVLAMSSGGAA